jgi:hypothetical protein
MMQCCSAALIATDSHYKPQFQRKKSNKQYTDKQVLKTYIGKQSHYWENCTKWFIYLVSQLLLWCSDSPMTPSWFFFWQSCAWLIKFSMFLLMVVIHANSISAYSIGERSTSSGQGDSKDQGKLNPCSNLKGVKCIDSDLVYHIAERAVLR